MSDLEDSTAVEDGSEGVLLVETDVSQHRAYLPIELQDPIEAHHRNNKAPAVSSFQITYEGEGDWQWLHQMRPLHFGGAFDVEMTERNQPFKEGSEKRQFDVEEEENVAGADKQKQHVTTKSFTMIDSSIKPITVSPSSHLTELLSPELPADAVLLVDSKTKVKKKAEEHESVDEIITGLTDAAVTEPSALIEEGEGSDMPLSESRALRVTRAMRQLFCCGRPIMTPSEMDLSYTRDSGL